MENTTYPAIAAVRKTGAEQFYGTHPLEITVLDFWRWSASDLVGNAMRGILAEFLVANALGLAGGIRTEWEPFDLITSSGLKVEVKSAAYLQTWSQKTHSAIKFDIRPTRLLDTDTGYYVEKAQRQADVYVFCLLHHQDKATLDPLNVSQWVFYILPAAVLEARLPMQKSIGLSTLLRLNPSTVEYKEIASTISNLTIKHEMVSAI